MTAMPYAFPLDKLLTLGDARPTMRRWPDYRQYGLAPEHIPDLVRMATDEELNLAEHHLPSGRICGQVFLTGKRFDVRK